MPASMPAGAMAVRSPHSLDAETSSAIVPEAALEGKLLIAVPPLRRHGCRRRRSTSSTPINGSRAPQQLRTVYPSLGHQTGMKLKLDITPDLVAMMAAEIAAGERAVSSAVREDGY
jgi:hypothetical protein